jgi:hypothetical protein
MREGAALPSSRPPQLWRPRSRRAIDREDDRDFSLYHAASSYHLAPLSPAPTAAREYRSGREFAPSTGCRAIDFCETSMPFALACYTIGLPTKAAMLNSGVIRGGLVSEAAELPAGRQVPVRQPRHRTDRHLHVAMSLFFSRWSRASSNCSPKRWSGFRQDSPSAAS